MPDATRDPAQYGVVCPHCASWNRADRTACWACNGYLVGAPVAPEQDWDCPRCGWSNSKARTTCYNCSGALGALMAQQAAPPKPAAVLRWDHLVVDIEPRGKSWQLGGERTATLNAATLEAGLATVARDGWELVSVVAAESPKGGYRAFFKKPA
ncbi:MAG: hypothetical protein U0838_16560 [Chloroflexota bacterium]